MLADNRSPLKAKTGDIAPEDIIVEPGPTDLVPGPAISELSGAGLKVAVEGGKLAIKQQKIIVYAGEVIKENIAGVMGKLGITPMKVGFEPLAAYDADSDKVYSNIKIDKKKTIEELKDSAFRAFGFAVNRIYIAKETIFHLFARAVREELSLIKFSDKTSKPQDYNTNAKEDS